MNKDLFEKIKNSVVTAGAFLLRKFSFLFVILLLFVFLLAGFFFYQYGYKATNYNGTGLFEELKIDHQLYQKVMSRFEENSKMSQENENRPIPNPFQ